MKDLEPSIYRHRLIIEGRYSIKINEDIIKQFLEDFAREIGMTLLTKPLIFSPNKVKHPVHHGIAGFVGWIESGCTIYTWDKFKFFTVDIYTCKQFSARKALDFTEKFFKTTAVEFEEITYGKQQLAR